MLFLTKEKLKKIMKQVEKSQKYGTETFFFEVLFEIFCGFGMKKEQGFLIIPEKEKSEK
jgi:hypothetical protein